MTKKKRKPIHFRHRISFKQAKACVLIAFFLGVVVSLGQIYFDFEKANQDLHDTAFHILHTVEQTASQAAYSLDDAFARELINGLFEYRSVYEAAILDEEGRVLAEVKGRLCKQKFRWITSIFFDNSRHFSLPLTVQPPPVSFEDMGKLMKVGVLSIKVDTYQAGMRFLKGAAFILFSGLLRNLLLAFILLWIFYQTLTRPFVSLEQTLTHIDPERPELTRLVVPSGHEKDEFHSLVNATNHLLQHIQTNISERIRRVAETERLKGEVQERKKKEEKLKSIQAKLEDSNLELSILLEDLKKAQAQLVHSEKMAALGELVASIAHEVNTPLGVGLTGATHLSDEIHKVEKLYEEQTMTREDFESFLKNGSEISRLIEANQRKAFSLIKNFKTMAVDQASEAFRYFKIKEYTGEILSNLNPKLKKTKHEITVHCDENLTVHSYPGYYSQVITNLVMNSVTHAFPEQQVGTIDIRITEEEDWIHLSFEDNGKGIPEDIQSRIFEPFFTTRRNDGGSGLGLHIVYSIVVNKLGGEIRCESDGATGTRFIVKFPKHSRELAEEN